MTCKNCLYFNMCYVLADNPEEAEVEGAETDCSSFADRSRYVVREKGEWEPVLDERGEQREEEIFASVWRCPACGEEEFYGNFCPNCGADMRKGENDGRNLQNE